MAEIKLNEEICKEHTDTLEVGNDQWFYDYHFSREDYLKFTEAVKYFEDIKVSLRNKLIKEGLL